MDVQKSLCIGFLTISDQYHNFNVCEVFFTKWLPVAILDVRKSLSISFLAISDRYTTFFFEIFDKMAAVGYFGCPKFTFLAILDQYRFLFFFIFFYKMAAGGHFGCPKITFDLISIYFTSIRNFNFVFKFLTKWLTSAILDVRNSLSIAFLAISDRVGRVTFTRRADSTLIHHQFMC